jgi:hypothetical protein
LMTMHLKVTSVTSLCLLAGSMRLRSLRIGMCRVKLSQTPMHMHTLLGSHRASLVGCRRHNRQVSLRASLAGCRPLNRLVSLRASQVGSRRHSRQVSLRRLVGSHRASLVASLVRCRRHSRQVSLRRLVGSRRASLVANLVGSLRLLVRCRRIVPPLDRPSCHQNSRPLFHRLFHHLYRRACHLHRCQQSLERARCIPRLHHRQGL